MPVFRNLALASPAAAAALCLGVAGASAATAPAPAAPAPTTATLSTATTTFRVASSTGPVSSTSTPSGSASAAGIRIDPLDTCVSCTGAAAGPGTATADGTALRLFGHDVAAGHSSGNQSGQGALLALPANPLLDLALLDWMTAAHTTPTSSSSHSRTAVADLSVAGGKVITVAVLESTSDASYTTSPSGWTTTGSAQSNGATADLGQGALVIVLLHSGTSSDGHGDAYVASLNGNEILSSQQTNGGIPITVPGVATIDLLAVSAAGGSGAAAVGTVSNLGGSPGEAAGVMAATSGGASGASGVQGTRTTPSPAPSTPSAATGGLNTPMTGAGIGLGGLLLAGAGAGLVATSRRRRRSS